MLAKKYRLTAATIPVRGRVVVQSRYFICRAGQSNLPYARFAVVVGAAAAPKATQRVALRRAVYQSLYPIVPIITPGDYVITLLRGATTDTVRGIINELLAALPRN